MRRFWSRKKQLKQVKGIFTDSGDKVKGYEIHIGYTHGPDLKHPAILLDNEDRDADRRSGGGGVFSDDNQIFCTYLHGVFDHDQARMRLLKWAGLESAGHETDVSFNYDQLREREIDRVADMLQQEMGYDRLVSLWQSSA